MAITQWVFVAGVLVATTAMANVPTPHGFFAGVGGLYSTSILASNQTLSTGHAIKINQPWGFGGQLGYDALLGKQRNLIGRVEFGYQYLGQLSFAGTGAPSKFTLQNATALVGLGIGMNRVSAMLKGGVAVQIGGKSPSGAAASNLGYHFATRVAPMVAGELGVTLVNNLKMTVQGDYIFGHQLTSDRMGEKSANAASGAYRAFSVMAGFTYYLGSSL